MTALHALVQDLVRAQFDIQNDPLQVDYPARCVEMVKLLVDAGANPFLLCDGTAALLPLYPWYVAYVRHRSDLTRQLGGLPIA